MKYSNQIPFLRVFVVAAHDLIMACLAFEISILARYEIIGYPQEIFFLWPGTLSFVLICSFTFWKLGLYRGLWHYASITDLLTIAKAVTFSILLFIPLMFLITRLESFPRTALFFLFPLLVIFLSTPRLLYRIIKDRNLENIFEKNTKNKIQVLMVGADNESERFIREANRHSSSPYKVIGIIDNSSKNIGRDIRGVRVWGTLIDLEKIILKLNSKNLNPQKIILSNSKINPDKLNSLLNNSQRLGLTVSKLPRITELFNADRTDKLNLPIYSTLQPLALEDLLQRPQQILNNDRIDSMFNNQKILVTGAGGTIGSEIVRQIINLNPSKICILDNNEFALYKIETEINERYPNLNKSIILGDIKNNNVINRIFDDFKPDIVFHAAALKHVPLVEDNPTEAIKTNILGTKNIANAAKNSDCKVMVFISSDKAVYPSSIMGQTKRIAEYYCQSLALSSKKESKNTSFVIVRFGNVLGSTGSVVPLFQRQIALGGPITVTHPDVTRYFMTSKEAVKLVLHASTIQENDEYLNRIFILDMGEPIKIQDLARQLIRMEGLEPDKDIKISYIGLRQGEKIHESLFYDEEVLVETKIAGIREAKLFAPDLNEINTHLEHLKTLSDAGKSNNAIKLLNKMVNEYTKPIN
ncbi:MAG: nucleotide sugar dehydratase [Rhodospirillaceae bacterium]|nr:nucleotide sugar dehydratase [Rhodospirillaceae bacterium]|tara:strand:+ start:59945 stop:61867 length:1923 start_codon:yes stop_codon:yes gene_type:complete